VGCLCIRCIIHNLSVAPQVRNEALRNEDEEGEKGSWMGEYISGDGEKLL